jgi:hypothetical protein
MALYHRDAGHSVGPGARTADGIDFIIKGTSSEGHGDKPLLDACKLLNELPKLLDLKVAGSFAPGTAGDGRRGGHPRRVATKR